VVNKQETWLKKVPVPNVTKNQLAYYARSLGLKEALYLVFVPNTVNLPGIREQEETVGGVLIRTYIVQYDEEKDF
jgi:hypothetical protein